MNAEKKQNDNTESHYEPRPCDCWLENEACYCIQND